MNQVVLLIGGNIGDRFYYLEKCVAMLSKKIGSILEISSVYETAAWGRTNQQDYLNQALVLETILLPNEILSVCQEIEALLDRKREIRWGERTIDIDIIFYNQLIIQSKTLEIPHPRFQLRNFVLEPLAEIIPNYTCPEHQESILQLLANCKDKLKVKIISEINQAL
jgi:2-amino-4-hydroxy-6-hydroxymethyldihydropteridine diphosphokinase